MKTTVELTKKQYEILMNALQIAGSVYGVMGDMVDTKYKKQSNKLDELESHLLENAEELGLGAIIDIFQGKKVVEQKYLEKAIDDLFEYDEYVFWDTLPRELAERDLARSLGEEAVKAMDTLTYIHAEYPIEDKYRNEFEKHGLERVEIRTTDGNVNQKTQPHGTQQKRTGSFAG